MPVSGRDEDVRSGSVLGEAVARDGVDSSADRRAHMRELTMARQAAERRHARPGDKGIDREARLDAARQRSVELQTELARIDAEHRGWLRDQGEDVPELRSHQRKLPGPAHS